MKIAMLCPLSPTGVVGGAERLWNGVVDAVNDLTSHEASLIGIAAPEATLTELVHSYCGFDTVDLDEFDLVITGKYPAWMVRHPNHVVHMCHPLRGLYDTYPQDLARVARPVSPAGRTLIDAVRTSVPGVDWDRRRILGLARELISAVPGDHPDLAFPGPLARELVHWLDADALHPNRVRRHLAISATVARRQDYFPRGVDVTVAVPPSALQGLRPGTYGPIFTASRLDGPKRVELILDAMAYVVGPCELRIAGTGPAEQRLRERALNDPRVTLLGRLDDEQLAEEYSNALVVPFVPLDEDLGLITLEAQMSAKPVVTCHDSGGVVDLVRSGLDGLVVDPDPRAIGAALSRFVLDPLLAEQMGRSGQARARDITWRRLVDALLAPGRPRSVSKDRRRVLVLNTYAAEPARHGGQVRVNRLLQQLGQHFDVQYLAVTEPQLGVTGYIAPGVWQTVVEPSQFSRQVEHAIAADARVPVGDVAAMLSAEFSTELRDLVQKFSSTVDLVILSHPYLYPLVRRLPGTTPLVYDAHNAEWSLKQAMYPDSPVGRALSRAVAETEAQVVRRAQLIAAVSDEDVAALRELTATLADFVVVPNGVDVSKVQFVTGSDRRDRRLSWLRSVADAGWSGPWHDVVLFMGSGHPPNVAAAKIVLEAAERMPEALFVLVGSHVSELSGPPRGRNVLARGVVEPHEMETLLAMCSVAVNPMLAGSGTNIKMLDYFAAGAPTVATVIGARGLQCEDNVQLLIAEPTPDSLIERVQAVCGSRALADRLAAEARKVAVPYDWPALGRRFAESVGYVMERRSESQVRIGQ